MQAPSLVAAFTVLSSHHEEQQPWNQLAQVESRLCHSLDNLVTWTLSQSVVGVGFQPQWV